VATQAPPRAPQVSTQARTDAVRVLSPAPREMWASVLRESSEATIFQTPEWLDACCAAGGYEDASRLYDTADGRRIVLPMVRPKRFARMRPARSMPNGWGFGGAIASGRVGADDVELVVADLRGSVNALVVKTGPLTAEAWSRVPAQERSPHARYVVDMADGFDSWWGELSKGTRNKIRKAEKRGVRVRWGTGTELAHVHSSVHRRWAAERARRRGVPVPLALARARRDVSARALAEIAERLGERCRIIVASIENEPVASAVMLFHGVHAQGWRAASLREADTSGYANYVMQARALENAAGRGYRSVDIGESGGVRSLIEFKKHFRAEPRSYDVLLLGSSSATSALRARDRLVSAGSRLAVETVSRIRALRDRGSQ
jgi:hypothetical protein